MKKMILSLAVAGLVVFTACKKTVEGVVEDAGNAAEAVTDVAEDAVDTVADTAEDAVDTVVDGATELFTNIPQVDNAEVQGTIDGFKGYASEVVEAQTKGDQAGLDELQAKSSEWFTKLEEAIAKLPEDQKTKVNEWKAKIVDKIAGN